MSTPSGPEQLAISIYQLCCITGGAPFVARALIVPRPDVRTLIPGNAFETLACFDTLVRTNPPPAPEIPEPERRKRVGRILGSRNESRRKLNDQQIRIARELYREGMTSDKIGERFGVCNASILRFCRDISKERRRLNAARRLVEKIGAPAEQVSKEFGIPMRVLLAGILTKKPKRRKHGSHRN